MKEKIEYSLDIGKKSYHWTIDLNHFYYIPFVGWLYPMALKKNNAAAMAHAKQGFVLACIAIAILTGLSFLTVFIHTGFRGFRIFIALLIYLVEIGYFALCILGTMKLVKKEPFVIPQVKKYVDMLNF